jgi:FkbM family methyltransferase
MTEPLRDNAAAVASILQEHAAVSEALVTTTTDGSSTARLVPDPAAAPVLYRSATLERAGRLGPLSWHEPADDLRVAGLNRRETDFMYREMFIDDAYFRRGIDLPTDAVVIDVGANIGMFSLLVARRSPGARIIAVEPVTELADAIRINAELHAVTITVLCTALGNAESESDFTFYRNNSVMSGRFADSAEDIAVLEGYLATHQDPADHAQRHRLAAGRMVPERRTVPVTTLAAVAATHGLERIDLLKIDVEKAEAEVLAGIGDALWPRIDRIVMELHDVGDRLAAVCELLRSRGFDVESDQDSRLELTPCHNVYARRPEAVAAVPRREAATEGVTTLRRLERDLRRRVARRLGPADAPRHFALATTLSEAAGPVVAAAAGTRRTAVLAEAWSALFGAEHVRPEADFFDLGGTSLAALSLLDRVEKELGTGALTPETIFAESTFGALAAAVEAGGAAEDRTEPSGAQAKEC